MRHLPFTAFNLSIPNAVKVTTFNALLEKDPTFQVEDGRYSADNEMLEWLFESRKENDIEKFYEGDGATGAVSDETGSFTASAAIVVAPRYQDNAPTKNFAYMVFSTEAEAIEAIAKFKQGEISLEAFEVLANEYATASADTYSDYAKGAFGLDAFDEWLFAADREYGSFTETPISTATTSTTSADEVSYIVAYYVDEGMPTWKVYVKSAIFYGKYEEFYTALPEKYEVKVRDWALKNVG